MMPNRLAFFLVTTCVLVSTADAQVDQCLDYAPTNSVAWPSTGYGPGSDFRRVVGGNFEGSDDVDGYDLVGLLDSVLVVMSRLHYQTAIYALDWEPVAEPIIADIGVLPDGIAPGRDGLLVSDADGLHLVELEGGTAFTPTTLAAGNPWSGASRLQGADLDLDGDCEVVAAAVDDATILMLQGTVGGSWTTSSFLTTGGILDLVAFEWTTLLAGLELAVLMPDRLVVYSSTGTLLRTFLHTSSQGQLARVRIGGPSDVLAWSRLVSGGGASELVTVRLNTVSQGQPTEFDLCSAIFDVEPVTLSGADYDGDGFDDLLLTHEQNETVIVMLNNGTVPYFETDVTGAYDVIPLVPQPMVGTGNDSIPFFGDLDGNGTADIVHGVSSTQKVEVWMNAAYARQLDENGLITADDIAWYESEFKPGTEQGELWFAMDVPEAFAQNTHVEVIVFDQEMPDNNPVNPAAVYHRVFELAELVGGLTPLQYVILDDLQGSDYWPDHRHYYMRYRFTNASGTSPIVFSNSSPWYVGGWTLKPEAQSSLTVEQLAAYMLSNGGIAGTAFIIAVYNGITPLPPDPPASVVLGAYVPMSRVPPFPPGIVPVVGPAVLSEQGAQTW